MRQVQDGWYSCCASARIHASICSSLCTPGPGSMFRTLAFPSGPVSAISRQSRTASTIACISLGSDSQPSRITGASCGSAERSRTSPSLIGRKKHGASV
jgi:hypothetical protein